MAEYDASREPSGDEPSAPAMSRWWWAPGVGGAGMAIAAVVLPALESDAGAESYFAFQQGIPMIFNASVAALCVIQETVAAFTPRRLPLSTIAGMLVSVNALLLGIFGWITIDDEVARRAVEAARAGIDPGNPRIGIGVWLAIAAGGILSVVHARAVAFCFREDTRRTMWE